MLRVVEIKIDDNMNWLLWDLHIINLRSKNKAKLTSQVCVENEMINCPQQLYNQTRRNEANCQFKIPSRSVDFFLFVEATTAAFHSRKLKILMCYTKKSFIFECNSLIDARHHWCW